MKLHPISSRVLTISMLAIMMALLAACGSTKVYTADKTVVHKGDIYNLSGVTKISTRIEGRLPNGDVINMKNMDKKAIEAVYKENDSVQVSTTFDLDDQEMVYQRSTTDSYRDYSRLVSNFESAGKKLTKFMADKKDTQLKL